MVLNFQKCSGRWCEMHENEIKLLLNQFGQMAWDFGEQSVIST